MIIEMLQNARLPLLPKLKRDQILNPPEALNQEYITVDILKAGSTYSMDDRRAQILIDAGVAQIAGEKNR